MQSGDDASLGPDHNARGQPDSCDKPAREPVLSDAIPFRDLVRYVPAAGGGTWIAPTGRLVGFARRTVFARFVIRRRNESQRLCRLGFDHREMAAHPTLDDLARRCQLRLARHGNH